MTSSDDPSAISVATSILELVADRVFSHYRQEITTFFKACIQHCGDGDVTVAITRLESECFRKAIVWHSTASERRFGDA